MKAKSAFVQNLFFYLLQFVVFLGTAAWSVYWLAMRIPIADWRFLAVGLLLAAVLGWWPWIALGILVALAGGVGFLGSMDIDMKIQVIQEIAFFWALGVGWGILARRWLAPPPRASALPTSYLPPPPSLHPEPPAASTLRSGDDASFRSRKLMAGAFEEATREPLRQVAASGLTSPKGGPEFPVFTPVAEPAPASVPPSPPARVAQPLPRPVLPPPPSYFGNETAYFPSLPGLPGKDSSHADDVLPIPPGPEAHPVQAPKPLLVAPKVLTMEVHLDSMPPRPPTLEDPSVLVTEEFSTMELPVNTLLRPSSKVSHNPNSSFHMPISSQGSSVGSVDDGSDSEAQTIRRSSSFLRPETLPGTSHEHALEWYNQFSWSPWNAEELAKRYYLPGVQVGWESLALGDLAKAWKIWRAGPVPPPTSPGQVSLEALEGFLRCEMLGVLRQQGFPNLHVLSLASPAEIWVPVYHEVRGRLRGGDAIIHRVEQGPWVSDAKGVLLGRPDRLAEIRQESDVVTLVTPFSVGESLNWTTVYAVAQMRVAETMGWELSGVPVVINLPLPIWDERRLCRVVVVEDVITEQRRLDIALERFNKVLSGMLPPKPQTQSSVCNGCGWRHFCSSYVGGRPRLDLSKPPQQLSAALR